jgi:hypothetical protein
MICRHMGQSRVSPGDLEFDMSAVALALWNCCVLAGTYMAVLSARGMFDAVRNNGIVVKVGAREQSRCIGIKR